MKKAIAAGLIFVTCFTVCANAIVAKPRGRALRQIVAEKSPGQNVYIGATTSYTALTGPVGNILAQQFSYITPENDFKQNNIHPQPGRWNWKYPDGWIEYAKENNQTIRIHGPISPQCSRWAKDDRRTAEELKKNLYEYMTALCRRYNGKPNVRWLDVVNETVSNSGKWKMPESGSGSWENPWPKIGFEKNIPAKFPTLSDGVPLYIIQAFEIASKEATNIKLVINQHGDLNDKVWSRLKELVLYLRSRGLRLDGIGWQGHVKYKNVSDWSMGSENLRFLGELIEWAHENNLEFHVTENNIHDRRDQPDKQNHYAEIIGNILKTVLAKRDTGVVTWNLWGLQDRPHYAEKKLVIRGFWDRKFQPKKSYYKAQRILEGLPDPGKK